MMFYIRNNIETQWYNLNETIVDVVAPLMFLVRYITTDYTMSNFASYLIH